MNSQSPPLLVTGSHRSGTTWVGRTLTKVPGLAYLHEPFNPLTRPGICGRGFTKWFTYVCDANEAPYAEAIANSLAFRYQLGAEIKSIRSPKDILRLIRDYRNFNALHTQAPCPLMKDPIALFSTPWLAKRFEMKVIVMIRHPLGFAGSLKKADWHHPFAHFLDQPLLMEAHLEPFRTQIEDFAGRHPDIVDQAILLWNIAHHVIAKFRESHPEWIYVRHEDLSKDPVEGFESLFQVLGLDFSDAIRREIAESSTTQQKPDEQTRFDCLQRDSLANLTNWRKRLTEDEINRVEEGTRKLAERFYPEYSWEDAGAKMMV